MFSLSDSLVDAVNLRWYVISVKVGCFPEAYKLLLYGLIQPDLAGEVDARRDEASRVNSRVYRNFILLLLAKAAG